MNHLSKKIIIGKSAFKDFEPKVIFTLRVLSQRSIEAKKPDHAILNRIGQPLAKKAVLIS